jgi:hypothetical protein
MRCNFFAVSPARTHTVRCDDDARVLAIVTRGNLLASFDGFLRHSGLA